MKGIKVAQPFKQSAVIRFFDILIALTGICIIAAPLVIYVSIGVLFRLSPLFFQQRIGRGSIPFLLVKLRTMKVGVAQRGTHLSEINDVTKFGAIIRQVKIDELPQLFNVLVGQMSIVGYRPCLPTQKEVIDAREPFGIHDVKPGITGLAQINGIDMSIPKTLAEFDHQLLKNLSVKSYFTIIVKTITGRGMGDSVGGG